MFIVREEYITYQRQQEGQRNSEVKSVDDLQFATALYKMLGHDWTEDYSQPYNIKAAVQTSVGDLVDELSNLYRNIADQATQHIHAKYVIISLMFCPLISTER